MAARASSRLLPWAAATRRGLSSAQTKAKTAGPIDSRVRLLAQHLTEDKPPPSSVDWRIVGGGGAVGGTGLGLLAYAHADILFQPSAIGVALIGAGGALAAYGAGWFGKKPENNKASQASGGRPPQYTFKLLNPQVRFGGEQKALQQLCGGDGSFPEDIEELLDAVRAKDKTARESALKARHAELRARVQALAKPTDTGATDAEGADGAAAAPPTTQPADTVSEPVLAATDIVRQLNPRLFVLEYVDPPRAPASARRGSPLRDLRTPAERFGDEVSLLLECASRYDEALIRVTSPGGRVSEFGLAASHLLRLKDAGIRTTVAVDTIAASGGYMLACCADRIVAAPFAFIGSIGVVAELPNVHRALSRVDIDYLLFTAGKYKRTVTVFGENTDEAKAKFQKDIDEIHDAFKAHVADGRGAHLGDVDDVATGEAWLALRAKERGLVDELCTAAAVIEQKSAAGYDVLEVRRKLRVHSLLERLIMTASSAETTVRELVATVGSAFAPGRALASGFASGDDGMIASSAHRIRELDNVAAVRSGVAAAEAGHDAASALGRALPPLLQGSEMLAAGRRNGGGTA